MDKDYRVSHNVIDAADFVTDVMEMIFYTLLVAIHPLGV